MELVHYAVDRGIATTTLDSPTDRNALSTQLVGELTERLASAAADESVRAVVLAHTGSVFCAGANLKEQATEGGPEQGTKRMLALLAAIIELPKPVVARIDGAVRAGGMGIVGACDIALASPNASFAFTEVRLGLAPAIISLTTVNRMTERAVGRYYLTGETFDADAAASCGLVTAAVDDLDAELATLTDAFWACSPQGLAESKRIATRATIAAFEAWGQEMQALSARLFASEEAREGMLSFLQKRPPRWAAQE